MCLESVFCLCRQLFHKRPKVSEMGKTEKEPEALWTPQFIHPNKKTGVCPLWGPVLCGEENGDQEARAWPPGAHRRQRRQQQRRREGHRQ